MRGLPSAVVLLFVAFTLSACQPAADRTEADVAAIQALTVAWSEAVEAGDVAGVVAPFPWASTAAQTVTGAVALLAFLIAGGKKKRKEDE